MSSIARISYVLAILAAALLSTPLDANANEFLHALKIGVLAHDVPDLWSGFQLESDSPDINIEAQFAAAFALPLGVIRPVIGASINTGGDTSHAYIDARWQVDCASGIFFGLGLGAAIHDGELGPYDPDAKALGSRVLFHIPAEIGYRLDVHNEISVYFEHISNGYTQDDNEGLDRIGVRYGYRF